MEERLTGSLIEAETVAKDAADRRSPVRKSLICIVAGGKIGKT